MAVMEKTREFMLDADHEITSQVQTEHAPAKSMFHAAMQSVERKFGISHSLKDQVEDEYLDLEIMRNLLAEETEEQTEATDHVSDTCASESASSRLLALKGKQQVAQSVHASIVQGVDVLNSVAERAGQVDIYLQKLECEIEKLESVEAHSDRLRAASAKLAQDHRDVIATNTELKRTVAELEAKLSSTQQDLEAAHMQFDRDNDEKQRLEEKIASSSSVIVKLESDTCELREQMDSRESAHADVKRKHYDAVVKIEDLSQKIREKDSNIARQKSSLQDMEYLIEQQRIAMADIRAKLDSSASANVVGKSDLSSALSKLEAERRENEARNSLQLKRIAELEAQNHSLNRQFMGNHKLLHTDTTPSLSSKGVESCSKEPATPIAQHTVREKIDSELLPSIET